MLPITQVGDAVEFKEQDNRLPWVVLNGSYLRKNRNMEGGFLQ